MGLIHKFFDAPERGNWLGPKAPRPPTPGLNLPPGAYIPDYKVYKLENAPELVKIEKRLAARGLKSPWLRNEVWRYNRKVWGSEAWRRFDFITLGWKYAIPMLIVTAFYEAYVKKDDHGHGHGGHAGGHH